MTEGNLLSYVGAISGIVGAITGIAGAVVAIVSYRKTVKLKTLDLRLELGKSISNLEHDLEQLPALLDHAKKSRKAISAARGMYSSGAMAHWTTQWEADSKSVQTLQEVLAELAKGYTDADPTVLEAKLIEAHSVTNSVRQVRQTYQTALTEDDRHRDHIREDVRTQTQARLAGK